MPGDEVEEGSDVEGVSVPEIKEPEASVGLDENDPSEAESMGNSSSSTEVRRTGCGANIDGIGEGMRWP